MENLLLLGVFVRLFPGDWNISEIGWGIFALSLGRHNVISFSPHPKQEAEKG